MKKSQSKRKQDKRARAQKKGEGRREGKRASEECVRYIKGSET